MSVSSRPPVHVPLLLMALLIACAPDLREDYPFDGDTGSAERVKVVALEGEVFEVGVDATSKEAWVYVDLDALRELPVGEALEGQQWELSFQRFQIQTNGGANGPGTVAALALPGQSFDSLQTAPADGYLQDAPDSVFNTGDGWYLYDLTKHKLSARDITWVVRSGEGSHFALRISNYYDKAGTGGYLTLRVRKLAAP